MPDDIFATDNLPNPMPTPYNKKEEDQNEFPAPVPSPLPEPTPAPVPRDETKTLNEVYAGRQTMQFNELVTGQKNPFADELDRQKSYRTESDHIAGMYADPDNLGGLAPDVVNLSTNSIDPSLFKKMATNWKATAYLLDTPVDQLKDSDYTLYKKLVAAKLGKNAPKTENEYYAMLSEHFGKQKEMDAALDDLNKSAVIDALNATNYGKNFPMVRDQGRTISAWMQKYPDLATPDRQWLLARSAGTIYNQTLSDIKDVQQYVAPTYKTLVDFTQGKATEDQLDNLGRNLRDLTPEQFNKVGQYVTLAAESQQIDRGAWAQLAKNLGESLSRGFDWIPANDIFSGQAEAANRLKAVENDDVWVPVESESLPAGVYQNPRTARELPKYLQMASFGEPDETGYEEPLQGSWRKATPEEKELIRQNAEDGMKSMKMVRKLRNLAKTGVDPIKPLAQGGLLGAVERGAYGLAGSIPLMGAVAVNPFFGVLAYQQNELDRILIENENMDLGAASNLALVEGGMNAVIDRFQIASLAGKSKVFGGVLKGMQKGGVANYLKRVGVIQTEQFLQENLQDLIAPVVETIASSLREDMLDKDFISELGDYWKTRPEVFFAVLPMALIGGGFASTGDLKNVNTEVTRERLRGAGISEEKIETILASETRAEMDERIREAWQSRTEEDKARGLEYLNTKLQEIKQTDTDHSISVERKEDGTAEWVVTDYKGEQVGRFADMDAAMEVISQNTAANLTNEKSTTAELLNWASKVLENPDISPDEKPLSVTQRMQEMQGIGDQKGIDNLMARLKFGDLQGKDPNKLYILGETTIEQVKEGVYRAVIKLKENASPLDALEEINHGFFKVALANGTYTLDTYQKWLEQTEAATGRELKRATEMEVIESLARVTEDYVMGRIDETSMPQSFVDYIKRIAAIFKEALARFLKMDEAFKTGEIDTDFQTALEQSIGIDPQVRLDRVRDQTAASVDPNFSVRDTSGDPDKKASDPATEQGTPAPDVKIEEIDPSKQTGKEWKPIPWREELQYSVRSLPTAFKDMDKAIFDEILAASKAGKIRSVYIDRMKVGEYLGVDLQGGMFYPTIVENLQQRVVWAFNAKQAAKVVYDRAEDGGGYVMLALMQEGNVIGNKTFTHVWFKALEQQIAKRKLTKTAALAQLNTTREKFKDTTGHTTKWKSLDEAKAAFLDMPQRIRGNSYFKKKKVALASGAEKINYQELLTQTMTKAGFPDAVELVDNIEEPSFKGLPTQSIVGIIKIDKVPEGQNPVMTAQEAGVPEHLSYQFVLKGEPVAKMNKFRTLESLKPEIRDEILSQDKEPWDIQQALVYSVRETKKSADEIEKLVSAMSANEIRAKLESSRLTPTPRMVAMLGEFPQYLDPIVEYMMEKRQDLVDGKVSPRDVAKAYWMTIASIGADAIDVSTIAAKAKAEGITFKPDPMFTTIGTRGQLQMRPEELAAYWLGTPEGQRALDNVDNGVFNANDWETGLLLRDAFGRNDLREKWRVTGTGTPNTKQTIVVDGKPVQVEVNEKGNWSFSLEEQNTPVELPEGMTEGKRVQTSGSVGLPKGKKANLTNLKELTDRINAAKGDPAKLEKAVMSAVGIGEGKKGFISHFLGFGKWSTIDAVELNMWLAGVGDTTRATEDQKMIAAIAKKASGQAATRRDLFDRIRKAIVGLRTKAKGGDKIPAEVAPHIIHHWIWDAAKDIQTTHEGLYYAMQNYSIRETPAFKNWFVESKVVDEDGNPKVVYHGTKRPDRVGTRFRKSRATSGPMAYFTDDPNIASNYATGKNDTSLEMPSDYAEWFKVKVDGQRSPVSVDRAWWNLTPEQRASITKKIYTIGYADPDEATGDIVADSKSIMSKDSIDYELRQSRGNALRTLVEMWLSSGTLFNQEERFLEVLNAAGVNAELDDPNAVKSAVYPVYLSIQNPLDTSSIPSNVVSALEEAGKRKRAKKVSAGRNPDPWDKNLVSGNEWLSVLKDDIANNTTRAWTRVPDWVTETLSSLGYDGIQDTGGKMGGTTHQVWIPFNETQVKSATGNRGTFDPTSSNINYSIREQSEIDRVAAAVDAVNRGPEGRLAVYQRAKEKFLQLMQDNRDALDAIKTAAITDPAPALEKLEEDRAGRLADIETEENAEVQSALQDNAVQFATRIEDANPEDKAQLNADAKDRAKILEKGIREKYAERKKKVEQEISTEKRKVAETSEARKVASNAVYKEKIKYEKLAQAVAELDGLLKVLPREVIGKVGGFATLTKIGGGEKALANFFVKRVEMVDAQLERYLNEEYDKQLDRIFERSKPKKANAGEKPKGIGADIQSLFSSLIASKSMTGAEVSAHLAGLDDKLNNPDLDLSPEEEARIMQEQALVTLVGDWKNADSNRRAAAVDALRETWAKGYSAFTANKIAEKDARVKAQQEAIVSTGKAGDYPERQTKLQKDLGIAGKLKNDLLDFVSWDQLLGLIFGDNSFTANRYSDLQRIAENSKEDSIQNKVEALESLFTRLAGGKRLDGEKLRWQLSQPSMVVNGLKLSELEGLTASMMWMQEDGKRHMEGRRDENGKIISRWSYNQNFIDQIEGSMSDEAKEVRRFLLDNYDREYQRINAVYRQLNGINLPRIQFYSPLIVAPQQAPQGMINDPVTGTPVSAASASPAALRTRGKSVIAEPQFRDALQTFIAHTKQMEHWIAYAPILKDLNGVLRNRDVQNSVLEKTGKESTGVLNLWLDLFAQGGNRDASNQLDFSKQVHSVAGRFAQVALVGRIGTLLVQSTQLAAALGEVPFGSYMVRLSKLLTGNLGWGAALKSDYIQRRLKEMPPVVQEAMRGLDSDKPNRLKYSVQKLGRLISGTDALFTAGTFAIVHDYHLTQAKKMGLSDAQAKEYADRTAERATDRVAQPTRMGSKSMVELTSTNAFAKVGWAFASEARKNFALATYALANKSFSEKARVLGLFLTANTILSGIIRNAWRDARDEEDDEWFDEKNWSTERMMLAMATEPLQGIPLVGSAIQDATYAAAGEYHQQGGMLSSVRAIRAMRHIPETLNGERDIEDMLKDLNGVLSLMGLFNQNLAAAASLSTLASDVFGLGKNTKKMMEE